MKTDALQAAQWAHDLLQQPFVILDTETTGLREGEIVEISVIDHTGAILISSFVKPSRPIPADAFKIHGISDAMVANAPGWAALAEAVLDVIGGKRVIVYNAQYDRRMMHQSDEASGRGYTNYGKLSRWECAMEAYAKFWGDWDDWHHSYTWQRLTTACDQQGIPEPDAKAHSALGDCLRTRALLQAMAKAAEVQP